MLHIHPNARTTPATRAEIARPREPSSIVARRYGISADLSALAPTPALAASRRRT